MPRLNTRLPPRIQQLVVSINAVENLRCPLPVRVQRLGGFLNHERVLSLIRNHRQQPVLIPLLVFEHVIHPEIHDKIGHRAENRGDLLNAAGEHLEKLLLRAPIACCKKECTSQ